LEASAVENRFNLEKYLSDGVEALVKSAMKSTLKNPKESAFLLKYATHAKKSEKIRHKAGINGEHIPSFLIASITLDCNLRCAGCYAHANQKHSGNEQLSSSEWNRIFDEAGELGVAMILLAGGEPLMRLDVIKEAAKHKNIIFPIFTNGTMINSELLNILDKHRNLVPILSIEGNELQTDTRRGRGIYEKTLEIMKKLKDKGLLYGVSITVTTENLATVTDDRYINWLESLGCKATLFVEYVPFESKELALSEQERLDLAERLHAIRLKGGDMILVSFPGDEKETGGCLAAGRGFFHINAAGGAEPCPFSPHSDTSLKTVSLRQALQSPLFVSLRNSDILIQEHSGGCTLFDYDNTVLSLLTSN
jgi:MoaA/NifB/PqqE/SkfB family radical SAM enzyme